MALDVIQKIADQIAHYRAEILRLESALEVIAEMGDKSAAKAVEKPMITIRKAISHEAAPSQPPQKKKRKIAPKGQGGIPTARPVLLKLLEDHGPMKSGDLTRLSGIPTKTVWNTMYHLKKNGLVEKRDDGFRLTRASQGTPHVLPPVEESAEGEENATTAA